MFNRYPTRIQRPFVKNNDAVKIRYRGKKMNGKVKRVCGELIEAEANGHTYVCSRHGREFIASAIV